jgi:putative colanic acid biosynthesis acetyltransferase WcaF
MEQQGKTDLSVYDNSWYQPGSGIKRGLWYFCNLLFLNNYWFPLGSVKRWLLRVFGAKIGKGVVIKPQSKYQVSLVPEGGGSLLDR